jgi:hypothetical protein
MGILGSLHDTEVYAVPGKHCIVDTINPATGRTRIYGHTEAEVLAQDPDAIRMTWAAWQAEQTARQRTPITWAPTTQAEYTRMLEVLPPALWQGGAFLVGEPMDHDLQSGVPRFAAYWARWGRYFIASRPLTCAELLAALKGGSV